MPNMATPTHVLEFRVRELADGTTPGEQFVVEGMIPSDGPFPDAEQIYVIEQDRLGLIDLSFSGILPEPLSSMPSLLGQRYVTWAWGRDFVLGAGNPLKKSNLIEDAGYVDVQDLELLPVASSQFYSRKGYNMPHGTVIRLTDMAPAIPGQPFILRLGIIIPSTISEDGLMRDALCCTEQIPTTTDSAAGCLAPVFGTPPVSPPVLVSSPAPQMIEITAVPVSPTFTSVTVVGPGGPVIPTSVSIVFPDKVFFTGVFGPVGPYDVTLDNGPGCSSTSIAAFAVIP